MEHLSARGDLRAGRREGAGESFSSLYKRGCPCYTIGRSPMGAKILVVEDEETILDFLSFSLRKEGYDVITAREGTEAISLFHRESPDAVLLDLMLPTLDGLEVLKSIRTKSDAPVLVVTAKDEETDKICGLELGADDYITKPFSAKELIARIRANLRKGKGRVPAKTRLGELEVDWQRAEIFKSGVRIFLTAKEFGLLRFLHENREKVLSREWLLDRIWGFDFYGDARVVDTTIKRLRKKIGPHLIETVRGIGYRLMK